MGIGHLLTCVDEVLEQRKVSWAFDKASYVPTAGTPTGTRINEKLQVDLPFLGDIVAPRATDVFSEYSLLEPARSENPPEAFGASRISRIGVLCPPQCIQMDEGGVWRTEVWAELRLMLVQRDWCAPLDS